MIRKIVEKDFDVVNGLGKVLHEHYDLSRRNDREEIAVYEYDGTVVGFVQYMLLYEVLELLYIVIDEKYRKKGFGSQIVQFLEETPGVERIILEVRKSNSAGVEFYKKNGFTVLREIKNYYDNGEGAYSMEKVIE